MIYILTFFWFTRTVKNILFWVYLWQLKEYHIGRFLAHFRTDKGKRVLFNKRFFLRFFSIITLGFCWYLFIPFFSAYPFSISFLRNFSDFLLYLIALLVFGNLALYFLEFVKMVKDFFHKEMKAPVLTKKTVILLSGIFFVQTFFLFWLFKQEYVLLKDATLTLFYLLIFDVLTPIIVSLIVLLFQPFAVLGRNRIIDQAKKKRSQFEKLLVVGITGSYGKTSTKEILATILEKKFKTLKTREHRNSEIGVSQCILQELKPEHEVFICEMAAYNKGGIKLLTDIARPKMGILTGINEQHLATFGSQENIIKTKFELITELPENGTAILNGDNKHIEKKIRSQKFKVKNQKLYSVRNKLDVWAENIQVGKRSVSFKVFFRDNDNADFEVNLLGAQNIPNILAAVCCAKELGMTLDEIVQACRKIKPLPEAMDLLKVKGGLNIINAAYSANPDGVISHLDYLKTWPTKKAIIMPCLIELGKTAPEVHKKIGAKIGQICDLAIITSKEYFQEMKKSAMENGMKEKNILFLEDPEEILIKTKKFIKSGDVVLLESRVPPRVIKSLIS